MNSEKIFLNSDILEQSREICKFITEPEIRNRAVANVIAAKTAQDFFAEHQVDIETGLHNFNQILCSWDISDIYINNAYVDVRLYFNEDEICVPKSHFDNDLLPVAYMFVKLNENLSEAYVTGFITPDLIDQNKLADDYYFLSENDLMSYYDVEPLLFAEDNAIPENFEYSIYDFIDNKLTLSNDFCKILLQSQAARTKFADIAKTSNIFNFISIDSALNPEIQESTEDLSNKETNSDLTNNFDTVQDEINLDFTLENENTEDLDLKQDEEFLEAINSESDDIYEFPTETTPGISAIEDDTEIIDFEDNGNIDNESLNQEEFMDLESEETDTVVLTMTEDDLQDENSFTEENIIEETITEDDSAEEYIQELEQQTDAEDSADKQLVNIDTEEFSQEEDIIEEENTSTIEDSEEIIDANEDTEYETEDIFENTSETNSEHIDTLFNTGEEIHEAVVLTEQAPKKAKKVPFIGLIAFIGALGYFGYNKFVVNNTNNKPTQAPVQSVTTEPKVQKTATAMPNETIENNSIETNTVEGTATAYPAIEKNLDASILVSNLSINWEVPSTYISSSTAKRYLTKIGKIIQLNLKTELLLLSKPPITNKIVLELEFNKSLQKFGVKNVTLSSGESAIDDLIVKSVNNILSMNLSSNIGNIGNLQGNPLLVIRL